MATKRRKPGARALANRKRKLAEIRKMSATEKRKLYPLRKLTRKELEELEGAPTKYARREATISPAAYERAVRWLGHRPTKDDRKWRKGQRSGYGSRTVPRGAKDVKMVKKGHKTQGRYSPSVVSWREPERLKDLRHRMDVINVEGGYSRGEAYKIPIFASHDFWYSAMEYHQGQSDPLYAVASRYFAKAQSGFKRAGPVIIEVSYSEFLAVCEYAREIRRSRAQKGASARAFLKRYKKYC